MDSEKCHVLVVGAGPAGSSCASLFSKMGAEVVLVDKEKFPRDKACGDAIGAKAIGVLSALGLEQKLLSCGYARKGEVVFSSPLGFCAKIPVKSDSPFGAGFVCRRKVFDSILFENAKRECRAIDGAEAVELCWSGGRVCGAKVRMPDGGLREIRANLVVGADGAMSMVARKAGVFSSSSSHACSAVRQYWKGVRGLGGNIEIHFLPECMPGYFWIFPLSESEANVGVGMLVADMLQKKRNLQSVLRRCMESKRFRWRFEGALPEGEAKGWMIPLASERRRCFGNGFVLVGDAAAIVDPFSGEGIGNSMKSAYIAAKALGKSAIEGPVGLEKCKEYEGALWSEIGGDVESSIALQRLGRVPLLLDFAVWKAQQSERVREELAGMMESREAKGKASDPVSFLLRLALS